MKTWLRHDSQWAALGLVVLMSAFAITSAVNAVQRGTSWIPVVVCAILALAAAGWFAFLIITKPWRADRGSARRP